MTEEQTVKAMELCKQKHNLGYKGCSICELRHANYCIEFMIEKALDLINRKNEYIERLREQIKTLENDVKKCKKRSKTGIVGQIKRHS